MNSTLGETTNSLVIAIPTTISSVDDGTSTLENTTPRHDKIIPGEIFTIYMFVMQVLVCGFIGMFGVITNIINIIIFIKQGVFNDSSTVTLLGLAIADGLSVATTVMMSIMWCIIIFPSSEIPFKPYDVMYLAAGWPSSITGQMARGVTAFVALERCVCVIFPFKVKDVFTVRCSCSTIIIIILYYSLTYIPIFVFNNLRQTTDAITNQTIIGLHIIAPEAHIAEAYLGYINYFSLSFLSVLLVLISTFIASWGVKRSAAWREGNSGSNTEESTSNTKKQSSQSNFKLKKEKKLVKMITTVSVIFLVCYMPTCVVSIAFIVSTDYSTVGKYKNLAFVLFATAFALENISSSINLMVYYRMSSKYRQYFRKLFGLWEKCHK